MPQEDAVKRARLNAYIISGTILFFSLLTFFYFHKEQDDKAQKQIAELQSKLVEKEFEIRLLKAGGSESGTEPKAQPKTQPEAKTEAQPETQSEAKTEAQPETQQPKQLVPPQTTPVEPVIPKEPEPKVQKQEVGVFVTRTGSKYHRAGCQYLSRSQIPISKADALAQGYTPCSRCEP
jgi:outer membrane biosynthesis protein TonB